MPRILKDPVHVRPKSSSVLFARLPDSVSAWTTFLTDPELDSNFFKASRLHFIGSWKARYQQILDGMPPPPPMPPPLQPSGERVILHIDMDCFFCSVAVRGRPEFDGMPVAVSWGNVDSDKATHGEISSANYEARKYGIRAGMFIGKAKELCPDLITLPYEFDKYSAAAEAMYLEVFALTPFVQGVRYSSLLRPRAQPHLPLLVHTGGRCAALCPCVISAPPLLKCAACCTTWQCGRGVCRRDGPRRLDGRVATRPRPHSLRRRIPAARSAPGDGVLLLGGS